MNLIGTTFIRASKIITTRFILGWPDLTEFDFRLRWTSNPLHELRYNVQINNISVVQRHCLQICGTFTRPDHMNSGPAQLLTGLPWRQPICFAGPDGRVWGGGGGGGGMLSEYRQLVYADDRYNGNILSFAYLCQSFLRSSREKSVKSICYLKIYIKVYLMHIMKHA